MGRYDIGTIHKNKFGCEFIITEKTRSDKRYIVFLDEFRYKKEVFCTSINCGTIRNPYSKTIHGVGFIGVGKYKARESGKNSKYYEIWTGMIKRCYGILHKKTQPSYKNVTMCKEWLNFQIFSMWCEKNYPSIDDIEFQLDKDLLQQNVDNKIYSPETCVFLPRGVNSFLANKLSNNKSGYTGVSWGKREGKWQASVGLFLNDKQKFIGYFETPEDASKKYQKLRNMESEKVKDYLRSLNYLPEHIISKVV